MKISEIVKVMEQAFPKEDAYEWDNVGLLVGDENRQVNKVVVCLDVTDKVLKLAKEKGAELIVAHHPVIFSPINRITAETKDGSLLLDAIENKIAIYASHTNCDKGENGINQRLCEIFDLQNTEPLEEDGLGRIGNLKIELTGIDFAKLVREKLNTPVRFCGDENRKICRVAICSGAGADTIQTAIAKNAEAMITGDTKYHQMLDVNESINVIDAGHYPTEKMVTDIFENILCPHNIEVIKAESSDVFKYL